MNYKRTQTHNASKITLGRYENNRPCNSDPGVREKLRNEASTVAFSFRLNAMVSRTTRIIRRTSRAYAPVSMRDAISFKSEHTHIYINTESQTCMLNKVAIFLNNKYKRDSIKTKLLQVAVQVPAKFIVTETPISQNHSKI